MVCNTRIMFCSGLVILKLPPRLNSIGDCMLFAEAYIPGAYIYIGQSGPVPCLLTFVDKHFDVNNCHIASIGYLF